MSDIPADPLAPQTLAQQVRRFVRRELAPEPHNGVDPIPSALHRRFHEHGLANWWLPEAYGGSGLSLAESVDVVSELAYGDPGTAFTLFISILATTMVSLYGEPELRDRTLGPMGTSGGFSCTLGSERNAGSDLAATATTVSEKDGTLIVNGDKLFATNADFADFLVVIARTEASPLEVRAIVVPRATPGVRVVKRWRTLGLKSAGTYQVSFDNCPVPKANALRGHGLQLLEVGLNTSRTLIAATAIGIARRLRDLGIDYARTRTVRDEPLLTNPVYAAKLGQIEMLIDVMRNQCLAAATEFDALAAPADGADELMRRGTLRSSLTAKMFCGQAGWQIAGTASEMFGGLGYTDETPIGQLLCDMRYVALVEGGDDVLRDLLFRRFVLPVHQRI